MVCRISRDAQIQSVYESGLSLAKSLVAMVVGIYLVQWISSPNSLSVSLRHYLLMVVTLQSCSYNIVSLHYQCVNVCVNE